MLPKPSGNKTLGQSKDRTNNYVITHRFSSRVTDHKAILKKQKYQGIFEGSANLYTEFLSGATDNTIFCNDTIVTRSVMVTFLENRFKLHG